jgi:hypothetical protein
MRGATHAVGALALVVATAAFVAPAAAAERPGVAVIAVAPAPGPDAALLAIADRLRARIAELDPGTLGVEQLRVRTALEPGADLAALERALDQARRAYLDGDFEGSLATLRRSADALERLPEGADVLALWGRVILRLARTELDLGHADPARATLERLLRAVPGLAVDPSLVSPRLVEELERARATIAAQPTGTLTVTSSAEGARVWVNGRDVGAAPVRLAVPCGAWRVSGQVRAARVGPLAVDVGADGGHVHLEFAAAEALRPWAGQGLAAGAGDRPLITAVGDHLGVARVVTVAVLSDRGSTYAVAALHDVGRGVLEREGRLRLESGAIPADGDAALAEFIVRGRTDSPLVQVPAAVPSLAARPPPTLPLAPSADGPGLAARQALRWSPVVAALGAAALTTAAVVQLRAAEDAYDRARRVRAAQGLGTASSATTYNGLVADGDAAKGRASLYGIGAGLSAAVAVGIGYLGYRRTGEFGPVRF